MGWFSAGPQTNPVTDTILADTAGLAGASNAPFIVAISSTVTAVTVLEHRNAANNANVNSQILVCPANSTVTFDFRDSWVDTERLRLRLNAGVTGSVQASIFTA